MDLTNPQITLRQARIEQLRALLRECRDWFDSQRKAISKGCGSSWDMVQCSEQIDKIDELTGE